MAKLKGLFLDDERAPSDVYWVQYPDEINWTVVRTEQEFIDSIKKENYDLISFDHDLGDPFVYGDGYDCVKKLIDFIQQGLTPCTIDTKVFVHSKNPIGAENIRKYWDLFYSYTKGEHNENR